MTIEDLAKKIGVSRSLVSMAFTGNGRISPQTRERILQSARELGYSPNPHAQNLARGHSKNTIGLFSLGLDFGIITQKIKIIQGLLAGKGFDVPLYAYGSFKDDEIIHQASLIGTLCRQQPRAIVCSTRALEPAALSELEQYQQAGGIVVGYDYHIDLKCDQILLDREDNTYQTAKYLLELGHRKLGLFMAGARKPCGERHNGFERALREYQIQSNIDWMCNGPTDEAGGVALAEQFLNLKQRPTGICIVNDRVASAFVNEVQRAGLRIPTDLSVICHDNHPVAGCCIVPLTTNTHPAQEIAESVVEMLCSRLDGVYTGEARQKTLRGSLIVRQSTNVPS
ncbi:HTH-type transcriptional repressor CytR [Abditibacteriota bacterium]|nr:HTH-type transcriptional repressor CytR [Abditibacteriota bacterium]